MTSSQNVNHTFDTTLETTWSKNGSSKLCIEDHKWSPHLTFKVRWVLGHFTWEPLHVINDLEALDQYLELEGVTKPSKLRKD